MKISSTVIASALFSAAFSVEGNGGLRKLQADCDTIVDTVCSDDDLSMMCDMLKNETIFPPAVFNFGGHDKMYDENPSMFTVFFPTDTAWGLFQPSMEGLSEEEIGRILYFHFYPDIELSYDELLCSEKLTSVTNDTSRTKCDQGHGEDVKHQNGNGNTVQESLPTITDSNIPFCGGMGHVIDHVMLPVHLSEFVPVDPSESHHMNSPNKMKSGGMTGTSYCTHSPDDDCYKTGWPSCCGDGGSSCPSAQPPCDKTADYCIYAPRYDCYQSGWPSCCQDEYVGCPEEQAACDIVLGADYCTYSPDNSCYATGWPACCSDGGSSCPSTKPPCDMMGGSYCTYAPDKNCWESGWPSCCADGGDCPSTQPECDIPKQCGRSCSGNYDCSQDGGVWDTGSPWCGICGDNGTCQTNGNLQDCDTDADCDSSVSVCGPPIPGRTNGFCVGK